MIRALLPLSLTGCLTAMQSYDPPGTLPGEAAATIQAAGEQVTSKTVDTTGAAVEQSGTLSTLRLSMGAFAGSTRFATLTGIEATFGMGWLVGDATTLDATTKPRSLYIDGELGGVIMPLYLAPGSMLFRLAGDFGVGFNRDDRYTYAGGRIGTGTKNRKFALDASVRRHFGGTPGNDGAYEDRARVVLSMRGGKEGKLVYSLGVQYARADKRTLTDEGMELGRDNYLLRGSYETIGLTLSIGGAPPYYENQTTNAY